MGFPPRLNGKLTPLPSDETDVCPRCGRKFPTYHVVTKGKQVIKQCPFCDYKIRTKFDKPKKPK